MDWLPAIEDCHFELEDLTYPEISEWLQLFGADRVRRLRSFDICGWAKCRADRYGDFHWVGSSSVEEHNKYGDHSDCAQEFIEYGDVAHQ